MQEITSWKDYSNIGIHLAIVGTRVTFGRDYVGHPSPSLPFFITIKTVGTDTPNLSAIYLALKALLI